MKRETHGTRMFVLFCTPCLNHQVHLDHFASFVGTHDLLNAQGIRHQATHIGGLAFIDHARNILCHRFLHEFPEATDLFFLDDDIGWPPAAVLKLLSHDVDMVAGVYPLKQDEGGFPAAILADKETGQPIERNGLIKAGHVPAGFLRIRRSVIKRMAEGQPTYPFRHADGKVDLLANIFRTGYDEKSGERAGEDVDFCWRWSEMGGEMWIDPDINFSHVGRKRWRGNFNDAINRVRAGDVRRGAA